MTESEISLADSVSHIRLDGRNVYLVGTAHVSKESVEDVRNTVEAVKPDSICVELCEPRYKAMTQGDDWKKMNIFKVIREGKAVFLLAQLILRSLVFSREPRCWKESHRPRKRGRT
ncbi:MAG: TraB/GumN family protein [Planctomycetota bacterium]|jgi:pheromone shutdown protein TraB